MAVPEVTVLNPPLLPSEIRVLEYLARHPEGARIGDIASGSLLAQSRVSTVVQRLKKRGWLTTRAPLEDTRSTIVSLRSEVVAGTRTFLKGNAESLIDGMLPGATQSERATVLKGLTILLREFRRAETDTESGSSGTSKRSPIPGKGRTRRNA